MKFALCNCRSERHKICPATKRIRDSWAVALIADGETYAGTARLTGISTVLAWQLAERAGLPRRGQGSRAIVNQRRELVALRHEVQRLTRENAALRAGR